MREPPIANLSEAPDSAGDSRNLRLAFYSRGPSFKAFSEGAQSPCTVCAEANTNTSKLPEQKHLGEHAGDSVAQQ